MRVNIHTFYDRFYGREFPYDHVNQYDEHSRFQPGDVVFDTGHQTVGVVLHSSTGGECRLDSDGMQPTENLRMASIGEVYTHYPKLAPYLEGKGINPVKVLVMVPGDEMDADEFEAMTDAEAYAAAMDCNVFSSLEEVEYLMSQTDGDLWRMVEISDNSQDESNPTESKKRIYCCWAYGGIFADEYGPNFLLATDPSELDDDDFKKVADQVYDLEGLVRELNNDHVGTENYWRLIDGPLPDHLTDEEE